MPFDLTVSYTAAQAINTTDVTLGAPPDMRFSLQNGAYQAPTTMRLLAALGIVDSPVRIQLVSPAGRELGYPVLDPIHPALPLANRPPIVYFGSNGPVIEDSEEFRWQVSRAGAAATDSYVLSWWGNTTPRGMAGNSFTARGLVTATTVVGGWTFGTIQMDNTLRVGSYDIIGMSVYGANAVAVRIISQTGSLYRPGTIVRATQGTWHDEVQNGNWGTLASFTNTTMPQFEFFGTGAGTQTYVVYLDLVKK